MQFKLQLWYKAEIQVCTTAVTVVWLGTRDVPVYTHSALSHQFPVLSRNTQASLCTDETMHWFEMSDWLETRRLTELPAKVKQSFWLIGVESEGFRQSQMFPQAVLASW